MSTEDPDLPSIPGYAVEAALGSGGMATVYRGRQLALDRPVAIKVVRAVGRETDELNRRFAQEARLIAALDHPNIVAIYEVTTTTQGDACYVMPLLATGDLASYPKPMSEAEIKRVLKAVLAALGHAHGLGVIHRDVKQANVLFDARGTPLLADFGVALKLESAQRMTSHGRAVGSSLTMSPEQARGEVVDGRSDLYSLACMTYELLTGYAPYEGDDFLAVALKHQQQPIPQLPERLAHWQPLIDCALAKRPEERYADADAMLAALDTVNRAPIVVKAAPNRRAGIALIALLGLAIVTLLWWFAPNNEPVAGAAVARAEPLDASSAGISAAIKQGLDANSAGISAAIKQRRWFDGSAGSADALLTPLFASEPFAASALDLRDTLLDSASAELIGADDAALAQRLPPWAAFVTHTRAADLAPVKAVVGALETRLRPALELARTKRDRAAAGSSLALALALPAVSAEFDELRQMIARFPARGEPFRDGQGPELLLIPAGQVAGIAMPLAVTRFEITRADYLRFVDATGRSANRCKDAGRNGSWRAPGFEQTGADPVVCVSFTDALAFAEWLSKQSSRSYRLPTLSEWRALSSAARAERCANLRGENAKCRDSYRNTAPVGRFPSAAGMPADFAGNVREWTATCEFKEIGKVERAVANFGRLLQGKERDATGRVCVGRYVMGSGWRDAELDRDAQSADEDHAAPDRGFRLIREIR